MNRWLIVFLFSLIASYGHGEIPMNSAKPHSVIDNTVTGQAPDVPRNLIAPRRNEIKSETGTQGPSGFISPQEGSVVSPFSKESPLPPSRGDFGTENEALKKNIYLDFENSDLKSFINYIGDIRNIDIVCDKAVDAAKISLSMRSPVTRDGAWNVFLTVLDMAGFSIVNNGMIYSVLPRDRRTQQPLPTFIGTNPEKLPDNDLVIRYVTFLNNIAAQEVKPLLASILSPANVVIEQPEVNGLIIIDKSYSIKSAMAVVKELDQTGLQEHVLVMRLKRANAQDVKALFDSLVNKGGSSGPIGRPLGKQGEGAPEYFSASTRMIVDPRTNSLILLGTKKALEKLQAFIVENLDTELKETESPLKVYELQHTDAVDMVEILKEVTANSSLNSAMGQRAAQYGAVKGNTKYFKNMQLMADKVGNRIIASTTDQNDWELLKETIRALDKAQPQVHIDLLIVTVSANKIQELGGQIRNKSATTFGGGLDFQSYSLGAGPALNIDNNTNAVSLLGNLLGSIAIGQGASLLTLGLGSNIWSIFKMLKEETSATVVSKPFILATNRTPTTFSYGDTKYVEIQKAVSTSGNVGSAAGKKSVDATNTFTITPQINMDGVIKLDIDIQMSEFLDTSGELKQDKNLKTSATVGNGQVLVVGGMVKTKGTESLGQTPFLSSIPILGWLAKQKDQTLSKEYVFFFICPTLMKPRSTAGVSPYTRIKLHQATDDVRQLMEGSGKQDPIERWFFNPSAEDYAHKVTDFANARYQPTTVDLKNDTFYRSAKIENNQVSVADETRVLLDAHAKARTERRALEAAPHPRVAIETMPLIRPEVPPMPAENTSVQVPEAPHSAPDNAGEVVSDTKKHDAVLPHSLSGHAHPEAAALSELDALEREIAEKRARLKKLAVQFEPQLQPTSGSHDDKRENSSHIVGTEKELVPGSPRSARDDEGERAAHLSAAQRETTLEARYGKGETSEHKPVTTAPAAPLTEAELKRKHFREFFEGLEALRETQEQPVVVARSARPHSETLKSFLGGENG